MLNVNAYAAHSATAPLEPTTIERHRERRSDEPEDSVGRGEGEGGTPRRVTADPQKRRVRQNERSRRRKGAEERTMDDGG